MPDQGSKILFLPSPLRRRIVTRRDFGNPRLRDHGAKILRRTSSAPSPAARSSSVFGRCAICRETRCKKNPWRRAARNASGGPPRQTFHLTLRKIRIRDRRRDWARMLRASTPRQRTMTMREPQVRKRATKRLKKHSSDSESEANAGRRASKEDSAFQLMARILQAARSDHAAQSHGKASSSKSKFAGAPRRLYPHPCLAPGILDFLLDNRCPPLVRNANFRFPVHFPM